MGHIKIVKSLVAILGGLQVASVCVDLCEKYSKISKNYTKFDKIAKIEKSSIANSYLILGG